MFNHSRRKLDKKCTDRHTLVYRTATRLGTISISGIREKVVQTILKSKQVRCVLLNRC